MAALSAGVYRPRHARPGLRATPVAVTVSAAVLAAAAAVVVWHAAAYDPQCAHWVNPEHLGWPRSVCQVQTKPAPAWWVREQKP